MPKLLKHHYTCHCSSYRFPHRMGGGKCNAWHGDELCSACGQPASAITVDFGIGAYEFWGSKGFHRDVQVVSDCCEAALMQNTHSEKEWFDDGPPFEKKSAA